MRKSKKISNKQLGLFTEQANTQDSKSASLDKVVIYHKKNFGIEIPYLLEHLPQYNRHLKQNWQKEEDLKDDNLLLTTMFGGIENSRETPPEIFEGLNALEICLMEAGIFKRKFLFFNDMLIKPKNKNQYAEPMIVKRNPQLYDESRIKKDGHLDDDKGLYEIMEHLLSATAIKPIHNRYKKNWIRIFQLENPEKKQKRFKKLNPYNPSTLKERMDYIGREYPAEVEKFREALAQPFIPQRIVKKDRFGNPTEIINDWGFHVPGKTYKRGVKGKSFYALREYAGQIHTHFKNMEESMQNKIK